MFFTAILIIVFMGLYVAFNRGNKIIYTIPMYFFCIAAMIITAVLYMSKVEVYSFTTSIDYNLYLMMQRIRINVTDVALVYNFCIAAFMFCSVIFIHFLTPGKYRSELLLVIPIICFLIWNAPSVSRNIFIVENTIGGKYAPVIKNLIKVCNSVNTHMLLFYMLCPFYSLYIYFRRTRIPTKKKISAMFAFCIALTDIFVYINFIKGTFSSIWMGNVDASKIPKAYTGHTNYTNSSWIILIMMVIVLLFIVYYNPLYSFKRVKKREMLHNAKLISENTFMTLHMYKNAFFAVGQQLELVKLSGKYDNKEKVLYHADKGLNIVESYMDMLNRTLELFKNSSGAYTVANIVECINEAYEKINVPSGVNIVKSFSETRINVLCNKLHMVEMFVNLLKNAVEAVAETENPQIEVSIVDENDLCMIVISDNGCGIKRKNLKKIFMPFYSSKSRAKSGGIGLSYVQKVIKQHHGDIIVKSEYKKYTVFKIVLQKYSGRKKGVSL